MADYAKICTGHKMRSIAPLQFLSQHSAFKYLRTYVRDTRRNAARFACKVDIFGPVLKRMACRQILVKQSITFRENPLGSPRAISYVQEDMRSTVRQRRLKIFYIAKSRSRPKSLPLNSKTKE